MDSTATPSEPPPDYATAAGEHGVPPRPSGPVKRGPPPLAPLELPILRHLRTRRVILASASPRRRALLAQLGLTGLEVFPSAKPEDLSKADHTPWDYVALTARQKCMDVYEAALARQEERDGTDNEDADPELVIAADTVVVTRDGRVLEKPSSRDDHVRMLRHLRDTRSHRVLTAVVALAPKADASHPGYEIASHVEETRVFFAAAADGLPDEVIDSYVATREGVDKAGGYAIQGMGGLLLVERVEGSVDNVIGLPVRKCLQLCERVVFRQGEEELGPEDE